MLNDRILEGDPLRVTFLEPFFSRFCGCEDLEMIDVADFPCSVDIDPNGFHLMILRLRAARNARSEVSCH